MWLRGQRTGKVFLQPSACALQQESSWRATLHTQSSTASKHLAWHGLKQTLTFLKTKTSTRFYACAHRSTSCHPSINSQFYSFLALLPHASVTYEILLGLEPQQHKARLSKTTNQFQNVQKIWMVECGYFFLGRVNTEESSTKVIKMSHKWISYCVAC